MPLLRYLHSICHCFAPALTILRCLALHYCPLSTRRISSCQAGMMLKWSWRKDPFLTEAFSLDSINHSNVYKLCRAILTAERGLEPFANCELVVDHRR